jgi:CPA2 family monovalent cation:H+ antiporter-2
MSFVLDLAIILFIAGVVNVFLSRRFQTPIFISYLLAGAVVGQVLNRYLPISQPEHLQTWSEIGIIFLLFSIGMEFSLKNFLALGTRPLKLGLMETTGTALILLSVFQVLPISASSTLAMAMTFTISSTAIIAKSLSESSEHRGRKFVTNVISTLIFEDIAVIFILLLLPTVAASRGLSGWTLAEKILLILSFIFISLLVGFVLLPRLEKVLKGLKTEGLVIFVLGFGLFYSSLSHSMGLSHGLGAFLAGSLLASLPRHGELVKWIEPIKSLFLAIFFVSTGMLFEWPSMQALLPAFGLAALVMLAKFLTVTGASLLNKERLGTSVKSGLAMMAMGEFSLLIAQLSLQLNLISEEVFQVLILSIFFNVLIYTFVFKRLTPLTQTLMKWVPASLFDIFDRYRAPTAAVHQGPWTFFSRFYLKHFAFHTIAVLVLTFLNKKALAVWGQSPWQKRSIVILGLMLSLPFFWALIFYRPKISKSAAKEFKDLFPIYQNLVFFLRIFLSVLLFIATGGYLLGTKDSLVLLLASSIVMLLMRKELGRIHLRMERAFFQEWMSFGDLEGATGQDAETMVDSNPITSGPSTPSGTLAHNIRSRLKGQDWDAELTEATVSPWSPVIGKTLEELGFREKYNVLIAAIDREGKRILGPSRKDVIYPGDRLFLIGAEDDICKLLPLVQADTEDKTERQPLELSQFCLESYDIPHHSSLVGTRIRDSQLRNEGGSLIIGIEREGQRILNPDSNMILHEGDRLWLAGERETVQNKMLDLERDHTSSSLQSEDHSHNG